MKICKKLLSVTLAAMMLVGMLTVTVSAAMPSHGLQSWDNVGSTVEEKNGGVYVMNLYDKSKVEFYFDNAYLSDTPVVLHTVHEDGRFYEDVTVIPLIIQPGCNIYFPDFTAPDEFLKETVGHFLASGYYIRDDGTVEIDGSYEWWFEENNLDKNRNITDDYIVTFEAGDVHYG